MSRWSRILVASAALLLALLYVLPLWKITLEAPQYPEGLGLYIEIDTITGADRNDLQNINRLNHYIGMAPIRPETFPELEYMPWIVGGLIAFALATAALGRRWLLYVFTVVLVGAAAGGLVDFYRWLYAYGHNLDPTAPLKIPGQAYQPPLIGSKDLLNFTAHSWPALGGWAAILAGVLTTVATVNEIRRARSKKGTG